MSLSSGVYSLIGVAVGGGITWGTQWALAARTDRLDARVAKRQVRAELRRHWLALYETGAPSELGSQAWDKHSDRLARQLSDTDWDMVERAYENVAALASTMNKDQVQPSTDELDPGRMAEQIDDALTHLGGHYF